MLQSYVTVGIRLIIFGNKLSVFGPRNFTLQVTLLNVIGIRVPDKETYDCVCGFTNIGERQECTVIIPPYYVRDIKLYSRRNIVVLPALE